MNRNKFPAIKEALIVKLLRHYNDKAITVPVSAWAELGNLYDRSVAGMLIG